MVLDGLPNVVPGSNLRGSSAPAPFGRWILICVNGKFREQLWLPLSRSGPRLAANVRQSAPKQPFALIAFLRGLMAKHRIYVTSVSSVYPHYVAKAERKGRTGAEVDEIMCWLTGHDRTTLHDQLEKRVTFEDFFADAPRLNPARSLITGVICGVRVEDIEEPTMREIRYLDKLVDELAKGRPLSKILRQ